MLALVERASYAELGIDCTGVSRRSTPAQSLGQTVVLLGEMQKSIDRLIENPRGGRVAELTRNLGTGLSVWPDSGRTYWVLRVPQVL